jgi:hypothetical protein
MHVQVNPFVEKDEYPYILNAITGFRAEFQTKTIVGCASDAAEKFPDICDVHVLGS